MFGFLAGGVGVVCGRSCSSCEGGGRVRLWQEGTAMASFVSEAQAQDAPRWVSTYTDAVVWR